ALACHLSSRLSNQKHDDPSENRVRDPEWTRSSADPFIVATCNLPSHSTSSSLPPQMSHSREGRRGPSKSPSPRPSAASSPRARRSRSLSRSRKSRSRSRNNLYVTGLSTRVTSSDLEKFFAKEGKVVECNLVLDPRSKESRGFAFVTMETTEAAERCIKYLNRSVLEGRLVTVEKQVCYV
ncbi:unnamed protein product, partial [Linum tenue]